MTLTFGSLFAGIGGFDLGLERAGFVPRWQVELDEFCRSVLARHWPDVPRFDDVRTVTGLEPVDLVCGGFPCQDIARVGRKAGIEGPQSGLWSEFHRVVRDLRPRFVLVENTTSLTVRGLDRITGDLAEIGYDAEWDCLPAAAFGAPHIRDRIYLLAYPGGYRESEEHTIFAGWTLAQLHAGWAPEPDVARMVDGRTSRLDRDRVRAMGNMVVPQVIEWIGRRIMTAHIDGRDTP
jgi:DNA (cytosine-5)-methyltransferase 1